nr:hypothetical protein [Tanacetum cinerariifolium]
PGTRSLANTSDDGVDDRIKRYVEDAVGDDVRGWIFRCEQFFLIDTTPEDQKVRLLSAHLFDKALMWHTQFLKIHGENVTWPIYRDAIIQRFGIVFDDPMAELKNVKYTSNAKEYQDKFNDLLSRVEVSVEHSVSLYVGRLPTKLEMGVRMFRPQTLADAYCLTNLQEATLNALKKTNKWQVRSNSSKLGSNGNLTSTTTKPLSALPNTTKSYKCEGQLFTLVVLADQEEQVEEFVDADET